MAFILPSLKEILAGLLLLIVIVSIVCGVCFTNLVRTADDLYILYYRSTCYGTAYICLLYALSTWFYNSNFRRPRQHLRYMMIFMMLILAAFHGYVGSQVMIDVRTHSKLIGTTFANEIVPEKDALIMTIMNALSIVIAVMLLICALFIALLALIKYLKWRWRHNRKPVEG